MAERIERASETGDGGRRDPGACPSRSIVHSLELALTAPSILATLEIALRPVVNPSRCRLLAVATGVAALLTANSWATAADVAMNAQLETQLSQTCPEFRAAVASKAPTGWSCWVPGPDDP